MKIMYVLQEGIKHSSWTKIYYLETEIYQKYLINLEHQIHSDGSVGGGQDGHCF
jgi:hypothetical protein